MGWTTAGEGQGSVLVVGPEQETEASRWKEDKARRVRLHKRALLYRDASALQLALFSQLKKGCALGQRLSSFTNRAL